MNILLMAGGDGKSSTGGMGAFLPIILIIVVFYFFMIRPQSKKNKDGLTRRKILVVDDDEDMRNAVDAILSGNSFQVLKAGNGLQALEYMKQKKPDLILCDIGMPLMNGYEVLKAIRNNPDLAGVSFVFLTGMYETKNVQEGMLLGADDYLTKPFTSDELLAVVRIQMEKNKNILRYYQS